MKRAWTLASPRTIATVPRYSSGLAARRIIGCRLSPSPLHRPLRRGSQGIGRMPERRRVRPWLRRPRPEPAPGSGRCGRLVGEELARLLARHVEDLRDVLAPEGDVERVAVVSGALAHLARHVHIRKEVHLDLDGAVACARLATATLDVEAEPPRQIATHTRLLRLRHQLAYVVEHPRVGGGVGARCTADRRLVDVYHLVEVLDAADRLVQPRRLLRLVDALHQRPLEDVVD